MNKRQEALTDIRYSAKYLNDHINNCDDICDEYVDDILTDCDILQELIDKETPKKPIKKVLIDPYDYDEQGVFKNKIFQCPNCKNTLVDEYECIDYSGQNYCSNCGQRLDWSDE
jgi:hypothetical protein